MKSLPSKEHFTAAECAELWGCTVQDLVQYGAYGELELMIYLLLTEGNLYIFRKGKGTRQVLERTVWVGFQTLSPMVCRDLQIHPDKPCPVTSIEPDQSIKNKYDPNNILGIDLFQPLVENGERKYQMVTYKDLWISKEQKQKFDTKKLRQPDVKSKKSKSHLELRQIFWRTYVALRQRNNDTAPEDKHVWDAIYDEYEDFKDSEDLNERQIYDTNEIIAFIDKSNTPNAHLNWYVRADNKSGTYQLNSLPGFLRDQKKNPPLL